MTEEQSPPERASGRLWMFWGLSMLLALGVSLGARAVLARYKTVYRGLEISMLPAPTELAFAVGPHLWLGVIPAAIEGIRRILKKDRKAARWWCLLVICGFFGLALGMAFVVHRPLVEIQKALNER